MYNKDSPKPKLIIHITPIKIKEGRKSKVETEKQNRIQYHVPTAPGELRDGLCRDA